MAPDVHSEARQDSFFFLRSPAPPGDGQAEEGGVEPKDGHVLVEELHMATVDHARARREARGRDVGEVVVQAGEDSGTVPSMKGHPRSRRAVGQRIWSRGREGMELMIL